MKIGKHIIELIKNGEFKKALVHFQIENEFSQNRFRYLPGDQVRFNWKARVSIRSAVAEELDQTLTVTDILYKDGSGIDYRLPSGETGSCDPFWVRPARKNERILDTEAGKDGNN